LHAQPTAAFGALASLVFFSSGAARAPRPRTLRDALQVRPGATCIDEAALREQVRTWLGADQVDGDLRVEVTGSNRDARVVSFRMWRDDRLIAHRRFAPGPAECAQMHAVLGLAVALALKVSLRDELLGEPVPRPLEGWSVGLAASVAWNVVPGAAGGAVLWGERALSDYFAAHLGVSGLAGGTSTFAGVAGTFSTFSLALDAALCAIPRFGAGVRGRLCMGIEGRTLWASGSGFPTSKETVLGWAAVSNSVGVSVEVAPGWSLVGAVDLVVPLEKSQVAVVDPEGRVVVTHDSAPVGGQLSVGGAYEF
jgi:hypothetical protein